MNVLFVMNNNKDKDYSLSANIIDFLKEKQLTIYSDNNEFASEFELNLISEGSLQVIDFAIVFGFTKK